MCESEPRFGPSLNNEIEREEAPNPQMKKVRLLDKRGLLKLETYTVESFKEFNLEEENQKICCSIM